MMKNGYATENIGQTEDMGKFEKPKCLKAFCDKNKSKYAVSNIQVRFQTAGLKDKQSSV